MCVSSAHTYPTDPTDPTDPADPTSSPKHCHHLPAWGHAYKRRTIFLMLLKLGRSSRSVDDILEVLRGIEGPEYSHLTENYFWIQMITYHMAVDAQDNPRLYERLPPPASTASPSSSSVVAAAVVAAAVAVAGPGPPPDRDASMCTFHRFSSLPHCQPLHSALLVDKYVAQRINCDHCDADI